MTHVNFNRVADDYSRYRAGLPDSLFERLAGRGIGLPGQRILDLGTGTATAARGFAQRGAVAVGLDIAPNLMCAARHLPGGEQVLFVEARAEMTPFLDASFDVVCAVQCWHWFDRQASRTEVRRILRPGGVFLIATFDWLPFLGNIVEQTEALIERYNPTQAKPHLRWAQGVGIYPQWLRDMQEAGFVGIESFSYDVEVPYTHVAWRGRIRASQGVGASLPESAVQQFDSELAELLMTHYPEEILQIPHRVFAAIARAPSR